MHFRNHFVGLILGLAVGCGGDGPETMVTPDAGPSDTREGQVDIPTEREAPTPMGPVVESPAADLFCPASTAIARVAPIECDAIDQAATLDTVRTRMRANLDGLADALVFLDDVWLPGSDDGGGEPEEPNPEEPVEEDEPFFADTFGPALDDFLTGFEEDVLLSEYATVEGCTILVSVPSSAVCDEDAPADETCTFEEHPLSFRVWPTGQSDVYVRVHLGGREFFGVLVTPDGVGVSADLGGALSIIRDLSAPETPEDEAMDLPESASGRLELMLTRVNEGAYRAALSVRESLAVTFTMDDTFVDEANAAPAVFNLGRACPFAVVETQAETEQISATANARELAATLPRAWFDDDCASENPDVPVDPNCTDLSGAYRVSLPEIGASTSLSSLNERLAIDRVFIGDGSASVLFVDGEGEEAIMSEILLLNFDAPAEFAFRVASATEARDGFDGTTFGFDADARILARLDFDAVSDELDPEDAWMLAEELQIDLSASSQVDSFDFRDESITRIAQGAMVLYAVERDEEHRLNAGTCTRTERSDEDEGVSSHPFEGMRVFSCDTLETEVPEVIEEPEPPLTE